MEVAHGEGQQQALVLQSQDRHVHLAVVPEVADAVERASAVGGGEQDEVVALVVLALDRSALDRQLVAVNADQRPDLARPSLPQPGLSAEEAVLTLEILRPALLRLVPGLAAIV